MKTENSVSKTKTVSKPGLKVKTKVKAGIRIWNRPGTAVGVNHNQTAGASRKLRVKTHVKSGVLIVAVNHNQRPSTV
jgi:hypothetical protein